MCFRGGHTCVAEDADEGVVANAALDVLDLGVALVRGAPDLEVHEELGGGVRAAFSLEAFGESAVVLVALRRLEMLAGHLVVTEDGLPVAADVAFGHFAGARFVFIAEHPAGADRRRWLRAVQLAEDIGVDGQVFGDRRPRLLRDDEDADTQFGHDWQ